MIRDISGGTNPRLSQIYPQRHALTAIEAKQAKPRVRQYKLADGGGLLVLPSGGKYWRMKYRFHG